MTGNVGRGHQPDAGPAAAGGRTGQKTKNGVRYVQFGCTAHSSRGGSICSNASRISEKKITEALIGALRDLLTGPEVQAVFAAAFERRMAERTKSAKPGELAKLLDAAKRRVTNATRLIVEMPDDLDLRRQREADKAEVRRLESEISARAEAKGRPGLVLPPKKGRTRSFSGDRVSRPRSPSSGGREC